MSIKYKKRKEESNVILSDIVQNFVNFDKLPAFVILVNPWSKDPRDCQGFEPAYYVAKFPQQAASAHLWLSPPILAPRRPNIHLVWKQYTAPTND